MKYLALVWSNLKRKKLRTSLTILSIIVAFVLYGLLCVIRETFTASTTLAGSDRLMARHKISFIMLLPVSYTERIRNTPGVASVVAWTWFNGIYQNDPKNFFGNFPVVPEDFFAVHPEFILPEDQKQAWLNTRDGAIIGRTLANRFGWKIGNRIPLTSPLWPRANEQAWEFEVVGIYDGAKKGTDTSSLFFRYDYFEEGRAERKSMVGWFMLRLKDPSKAAEVSAAIDKEFENSPYETKTETEAAMAQGFAQQVGDIGLILTYVLSAVFFTILLVAANTMAQAVRERTEEIGVLKAMGFTDELVLALVLAESIVIAVVGGLIGIGIVLLMTAGGSPVPDILPVFYLPQKDVMTGIGLMIALGIIAGIVPALQAMRLQIAVALRRHA
jgi:putative ABC transport system permease protein